jgi:hypothetical protein
MRFWPILAASFLFAANASAQSTVSRLCFNRATVQQTIECETQLKNMGIVGSQNVMPTYQQPNSPAVPGPSVAPNLAPPSTVPAGPVR